MAVARQLGRARAAIDRWNFEAGDDLLRAMQEYVADAGLFVLIASAASKESIWVRFEARIAEYMTASVPDRQVLVLLLGSGIAAGDLPEWLQRYNAVPVHNPNEAASYISRRLAQMTREQVAQRFVGRSTDYDVLEGLMLERGNPRIFYLSGVTGIGRQSLAEELARRLLDLRDSVTITLQDGDDLGAIVAKLAPYGANLAADDSLVAVVDGIKNAGEDALFERFVTYCRRIDTSQRLIVFRDAGGIVSPDGLLNVALRRVLERLDAEKVGYCALIARRFLRDPAVNFALPARRLDRMTDEDMKRLMSSLMRQSRYELTVLYLDDLLDYLNGFPPAAYLASQLINDYGPDVLERDKRPLTQFQANSFVNQLMKDDLLTPSRRAILSTLLSYSPLPFSVLEAVLPEGSDIAGDIRYLMDYGFVSVDDNGYFLLSPPLIAAVGFQIGYQLTNHAAVADNLANYINTYSAYEKSIDLHRALFRSLALSGQRTDHPLVIELTSDIFRLQERLYHGRKFKESVGYGKLVLERQPDNLRSLTLLIRAYAQLYEFDYAHAYLNILRERGRDTDVAYLEGFAERKAGKHHSAIEHFKSAIALGRDDVIVYRDLAFSYFALNELDEASYYLEKARARGPNNRYVLDLAVQIALRQNDVAAIPEKMTDLSRVDHVDHYKHRQSDVSYFMGDYPKAYKEACESVELAEEVPLAFSAQVIKCEIQLGYLKSASEHLDQLDRDFPNLHHDVKLRLRIKFELASHNPEEALSLTERFAHKGDLNNLALRRAALVALLSAVDIDDPRRTVYQRELDRLHIDASLQRMT
jgi:tetratricopeptide (TPR) repeat protein